MVPLTAHENRRGDAGQPQGSGKSRAPASGAEEAALTAGADQWAAMNMHDIVQSRLWGEPRTRPAYKQRTPLCCYGWGRCQSPAVRSVETVALLTELP